MLVVPTAPLLWLLIHRSFWAGFGRPAVAGTCVLVVYAVCLAWFAIRHPIWLRFLAVPAALLIVYEVWRARPSYGRGQRLPPGSLAPVPFFPVLDDRAYLKESARHGGVFESSATRRSPTGRMPAASTPTCAGTG